MQEIFAKFTNCLVVANIFPCKPVIKCLCLVFYFPGNLHLDCENSSLETSLTSINQDKNLLEIKVGLLKILELIDKIFRRNSFKYHYAFTSFLHWNLMRFPLCTIQKGNKLYCFVFSGQSCIRSNEFYCRVEKGGNSIFSLQLKYKIGDIPFCKYPSAKFYFEVFGQRNSSSKLWA